MPAIPVPTTAPRWLAREHTEPKAHFQALDTDVDNLEAAVQIGAATEETHHKEVADKLDAINARMFGVLVSLISTALLLAGNLVFHH